jgi:hypothetical protein
MRGDLKGVTGERWPWCPKCLSESWTQVARMILCMLPWLPAGQMSAVSLCVLGGQVSLWEVTLGAPRVKCTWVQLEWSVPGCSWVSRWLVVTGWDLVLENEGRWPDDVSSCQVPWLAVSQVFRGVSERWLQMMEDYSNDGGWPEVTLEMTLEFPVMEDNLKMRIFGFVKPVVYQVSKGLEPWWWWSMTWKWWLVFQADRPVKYQISVCVWV